MVNTLTCGRGEHDVALRVRSGRHSLEGWSNVDNGIVIDISELKSVHIDTASRIATVGAGLSQLEAATLAKKDLAVTTGTEGAVGLSGATLGGGFGFLTRYLGMACDSLVELVVVASGTECAKVVKADLNNNSDLLWALRGAGNSNSGIVTSLTYKAAPLKSVTYVQATWAGIGDLRGSSTHGSVRRRPPTTASEPRSRSTETRIPCSSRSSPKDHQEGARRTSCWPHSVVGNPHVSVQVGNWGDVYADPDPTGDKPRTGSSFRSWPEKAVPEKAMSLIASFMQDAPTDDSNFFTQAFGGAVRKSPRGGTAFPHTQRAFLLRTRRRLQGDSYRTARCLRPSHPQAQAWIAEFSQALRPYVNGAYVNVPNIGMQDWETAYWGRNFDRLRKIKAKYNPRNVFQYEQSIPPAFCSTEPTRFR